MEKTTGLVRFDHQQQGSALIVAALKDIMSIFRVVLFVFCLGYGNAGFSQGPSPVGTGNKPVVAGKGRYFVHPGLLQNRQDLEQLRKSVNAGEQPWKDVYEKVKASFAADFDPGAVTHITRGTGGRLSIGGSELQSGARQAYAAALLWYITGEKRYAGKAISILNQWSGKLWDFEGNDAKLLAAWTGHVLTNAAEILRYSGSGWQQKDIDRFQQMLLTVYYPLLRNFFTEANGNWDGAIINTMLCIGVFCDDSDIFNSAVEHFLYGKGNGGITKYVYPTGQCEESTRDQGHTQLGLGEFAEACQVAWTQGTDLYGVANNRLALGFEYTAKYMVGENVPVYGNISGEGRGRYSNVYESVYQHYHSVKGLELPYTKRAVDSARSKRGIEILSAVRAVIPKTRPADPLTLSDAIRNGALDRPMATRPSSVITVLPGESVQAALDKAENSNTWVVLSRGVHVLSEPLRMRSGLTLAGEGRESILFLDPRNPSQTGYAAIVNGSDSLHDVALCDFVVEGANAVKPFTDPNHDRRLRSSQLAQTRAGILFIAQAEERIRNIQFRNVTVQHCTHNGVALKGVTDFRIIDCDFSDNGGSVAPGWGSLHNLLLFHASKGEIRNSRFDDSPWGCGIELTFGSEIIISNTECARNYVHGISVAESRNVTVEHNLAESNDSFGIFSARLFRGNQDLVIKNNIGQCNGQSGKR